MYEPEQVEYKVTYEDGTFDCGSVETNSESVSYCKALAKLKEERKGLIVKEITLL